MSRVIRFTVAIGFALTLAACGGGGGNGGEMDDTMRPPANGDTRDDQPSTPVHAVSLPDAHGLAEWLVDNPGGSVTVPAGGHHDAGGVRFSCPADGADCAVAVTSADNGALMVSSTGGMASAGVVPPPVHDVRLPDAHGLAEWLVDNPGGSLTVPAGEHHDVGGVRFSCPVDGADCAVAVTSSGGALMVSSTGGMASAVVVPPAVHAVSLPDTHGLVEWVDDNPGGSLTVPAGEHHDVGGVRFSCPVDGADCAVAVTGADNGAVMVSSTGGMASADVVPPHSSGLSDIRWNVNPDMVRETTGMAPPSFESQDTRRVLNSISHSADTLLVSDVLGFEEQGAYRGQTTCNGATCNSYRPGYRVEWEYDLSGVDFFDPSFNVPSVSEHRGVSLFTATTGHDEFVLYGGWLDHSYIFVTADLGPNAELEFNAFSAGRAAGTNPIAGSATWAGVMVGWDVGPATARGHLIQGDAEISIADLSDPRLGVAFTNIVDLNAGNRRDDMIWRDLSVNDGGFGTGSDGNSIEGKFYGPRHEEVGGIFERDQVVGAFGAKRPSPPDDNGGSVMVQTRTDDPMPPPGDNMNLIDRLSQSADTLLMSDLVFFTEYDDVRVQTSCSGAVCTMSALGVQETISLSELFEDSEGDWPAATETHRGVSLAREAGIGVLGAAGIGEAAAYAGWLEHNAFVAAHATLRDGLIDAVIPLTMSFGDATGKNPNFISGSATWSGVMIGVERSATASQFHEIRGDADLTIANFNNPRIDVAFTNIEDLDTGGSRDDMTWSGIPLTDGGFGTGSDGNSIHGKFYGPDHEEVGGIFERGQVFGGFSAKR